MPIHTYLNFNGNCREVVQYYAKVFEAEEPQILTFADLTHPDHPIPEEVKNLVMHTRLTICGTVIMFSDVFPTMPFQVGNNISLALVCHNLEKIKETYQRLAEGGKVMVPMQETDWSKCYGSLLDKYDVNWQLSYEEPENGIDESTCT